MCSSDLGTAPIIGMQGQHGYTPSGDVDIGAESLAALQPARVGEAPKKISPIQQVALKEEPVSRQASKKYMPYTPPEKVDVSTLTPI